MHLCNFTNFTFRDDPLFPSFRFACERSFFFLNKRTKIHKNTHEIEGFIEGSIHAFFQLSAFEIQKASICGFVIIYHRYFINNFRYIDERSSFFFFFKLSIKILFVKKINCKKKFHCKIIL